MVPPVVQYDTTTYAKCQNIQIICYCMHDLKQVSTLYLVFRASIPDMCPSTGSNNVEGK